MHRLRASALGTRTRSAIRPRPSLCARGSEVHMIYDEYLTTAEMQRWILEVDVAWNQIDRELALSQRDLLDQMHDSALIESYFPVYTGRLLRSMWDQIDVTSVFSVQLYESYKHFYALNRYLTIVDYRPVTDEELIVARERN